MADFACVLAAVDDVCGTDGLSRFTSKARGLDEDSLDADPFLTALRSRLERTVQGTAVELLAQVTPGDETWRPPREWPKNSRQVTTFFRRNAPALRHAGWTIEDLGAENKQHATVWQISAPTLGGPTRNRADRAGVTAGLSSSRWRAPLPRQILAVMDGQSRASCSLDTAPKASCSR